MRFTHHAKLLALGAALAGLLIVPSIGEVSKASGDSCGPIVDIDGNDFHQVSTQAQLEAVARTGDCGPNSNYILTNDIQLTGAWVPIPIFTGIFDGAGHTISGLTVNSTGPEQNLGMFATVGDDKAMPERPGVVRNIRLVNAEVTSTHSSTSVGGLVGELAVFSEISQAHVSGSIVLKSTGARAGLIVGQVSTASIEFSSSSGTVDGSDTDAVNYTIGGLAGRVNFGTVSNSYSTATVKAKSDSSEIAGGLVGTINAVNAGEVVTNSYSTGKVEGGFSASNRGGLIGNTLSSATVSNSFWDTQTSTLNNSAGGTGKTTTEMKQLATYTDASWAIVSGDSSSAPTVSEFTPWAIGPSTINGGYPYLLWETCGPLSSDGFHEISTASQLKKVASGGAGQGVCGLGANYRLMASINLENQADWVPLPGAWVGSAAVPAFDGTFDGNRDQGFSISNLKSVNEDVKDVGLFAVLGFNANVFNLNLEGFDIKPRDDTAERVGALAGRNGGNVSGVELADSVVSNDNKEINQIGGLIGENQSEAVTENQATVEGSSVVSTNVTGSGTKNSGSTGGIVGRNTGTNAVITDSYFWGGVVTGQDDTGGVVGENRSGALVDDVFFSGTVNGVGDVGGVVGENSARVTRALGLSLSDDALSSVTGGRDVGGLVGRNRGVDGEVTLSYSEVSVFVSTLIVNDQVGGGLVGRNQAAIENSYARGNVTLNITADDGNDRRVGGLVGVNDGGQIGFSYSAGAVTSTTDSDGAIGGSISGSSSAVFFDRDTTGVEGSPVGRRTTQQMTTITTFSGWDIAACATPGEDTIWGITAGENDGYPFLTWEAGFELSACPAPVQPSTQTTNPRSGGQTVDPE